MSDNKFITIVIGITKQIIQRDLQGMAAQIAYRLIFALMPMLIFLTASAGFVAQRIGITNAMDHITGWLQEHASPEIANVLAGPIAHALKTNPESLLTFGGLLTLWSARGAVASIISGLNLAYGVKDGRSWIVRQLLYIGLTIGLAVCVVVSSLLNLLGSEAGKRLAGPIQLGSTWLWISAWLQWPVTTALVIVLVALLHFLGPDVHVGFGWILPGALLTVMFWIAAIYLLRFYFGIASGFAEAYGVFGAMLAVSFWIYIMGLILLIGGTVNAVIHRVLAPQADQPQPDRQTAAEHTA